MVLVKIQKSNWMKYKWGPRYKSTKPELPDFWKKPKIHITEDTIFNKMVPVKLDRSMYKNENKSLSLIQMSQGPWYSLNLTENLENTLKLVSKELQ